MLEATNNMDYVDNESTQEIERASEGRCKEEFDAAVASYYSKETTSNRAQYWPKTRVNSTIQLVEEYKSAPSMGKKRSSVHYHRGKKYDVMEVCDEKYLVLKRKTVDSPIVQIIPCEEYYDTLSECHKSTRHGGRDKMTSALKNKCMIPRPAIELFLKLCKTCSLKKPFPKTNVGLQPGPDFNSCGLVNILDLQMTPDNQFKWLLNYQDYATKFCHLRPLTSIKVVEIANELLKIFLDIGCPNMLQSDNGRQFTTSVIKELVRMWPECKMVVKGHPRFPVTASQSSVDSGNQDVEIMLRAWMHDKNCTEWSMGCYYIQWQLNTTYHHIINKSPYCAVFGTEPKIGFKSANIPRAITRSPRELVDHPTSYCEVLQDA